jgi:multisubunit Na+/H+ antiporter MnhG subunit
VTFAQLVACGLLWMATTLMVLAQAGLSRGNVYDRLHFLGVATVAAPSIFALAIAIKSGSAGSSVKVILLALILVVVSPVLTHATAEAGFRRNTNWKRE